MDMGKVIGSNISKLIEEYSISIESAANILGVTRQTFSKYIKGESVIDSGKLFKLAKFFNKPMKYFISESHEELSFMFRADNPDENFDEKTYNYINKKFNDYYDMLKLANLNNLIVIPEEYKIIFKGNKITEDEKNIIKGLAEKQRKILDIDSDIEVNLYEVLDRNGINILSFKIDNSNLDAVSAYSKEKGAFIFVNDDMSIPEERKIFSLIHEYGHLIMHRDMYDYKKEELSNSNYKKEVNEKAANLFASYFLIPRDLLNIEMRKYRGYIDLKGLIKLKRKFGVSTKALLLAIFEEKYISGAIYGALNKKLNESGYEVSEPQPIEYISKNDRLFYLLKSLYLNDQISTNKISELLDIDILEGRRLIKEWADDENNED